MSFYKRHLSTYGYDRKLIFIIDKLNFYLKDEIGNLGFDHVVDNQVLLVNDVKNTSIPGYGIIDGDYVLVDIYESKQKARERIFQILCSFRKSFEKLGRFTFEVSSYDDEAFYLVSCLDKKYKLISASIDEYHKVLVIKTNPEIINYVCDNYLISLFRKERFGLIAFDDNQSVVLKIKKQVKEKFICFESDKETIEEKKLEMQKELIPYFIVITSSLAKKNQVKIVSFVEDFEYNADINSLSSLLDLYDKKTVSKIYNLTLKEYLNQNIQEVELCKKCAEKENGVFKPFSQKLNLKPCKKCGSLEEVMSYINLVD